MAFILPSFIAFVTSLLACIYLSRSGSRLAVADEPNHRSLHSVATARGGGLGILLGIASGWVVLALAGKGFFPGGPQAAAGLALIVAASYWDDFHNMSPGSRLLFQFAAGALALAGGGNIDQIGLPRIGALELSWLAMPFSFLFIIWMMNLYNFMDGMDGFSGGMGAIGFAVLAYFGWIGEAPDFAAFSLILSAVNLGFLIENFPPARIFMGDVGSVPMGYLVAIMAIWGVQADIFEFWGPVLIFAPFIFDATLTLIRRALRGEKIWSAHSSHYYQRLVKAGWGHRRVVIAEYAVMLVCGTSAVLLHRLDNDGYKLFGLALILSVCIVLFRLVDKKAPAQPIDSNS